MKNRHRFQKRLLCAVYIPESWQGPSCIVITEMRSHVYIYTYHPIHDITSLGCKPLMSSNKLFYFPCVCWGYQDWRVEKVTYFWISSTVSWSFLCSPLTMASSSFSVWISLFKRAISWNAHRKSGLGVYGLCTSTHCKKNIICTNSIRQRHVHKQEKADVYSCSLMRQFNIQDFWKTNFRWFS